MNEEQVQRALEQEFCRNAELHGLAEAHRIYWRDRSRISWELAAANTNQIF